MAFNPPDFNLLGAWWVVLVGHSPAVAPPDFADIPMQLYRPSRDHDTLGAVMIRMPQAYEFLEGPLSYTTGVRPFIECPQGSGNYYLVGSLVWMHRGFPNEYIVAMANPCTDTGALRSSDGDLRV